MTIQEIAKQLKEVIDQIKVIAAAVTAQLGDDVKVQVPDFVPGWSGDSVAYALGDVVTYENLFYRCIHAHTSQATWMPNAAFTEWAEILVPLDAAGKQCAILEWKQPSSTDPYKTGDKVSFNGVYYKSTIDNNSWGPVGSSNPYADGWEVTDASL